MFHAAAYTAVFLLASAPLFLVRLRRKVDSAQVAPRRAYILFNQVIHVRLLPAPAAHAFTYPTLSLLLSLNALESGALDLARGFVFGYGSLWGRLTSLRPAPYLYDRPGLSIRAKLCKVLANHGYAHLLLDDAWMMTMPSFLGYEGINPLTVYFCYKTNDVLWIVVLEVHNTFGESHVYVLEIGKNEDTAPDKKFAHQWTFRREFHVSPFNDRSGFYKVSVQPPNHAPTIRNGGTDVVTAPRPVVRVHLYTANDSASASPASTPGPLKLTALLRPSAAVPLTTRHLLSAIAGAPLALLLSFPRIAYHAWILHYVKRLDVYLRPAPLPAQAPHADAAARTSTGGVKWLKEGILERRARALTEVFLAHRVAATGISVTLISSDPTVPPRTFHAFAAHIADTADAARSLTITFSAPRFFTLLFTAPSAAHALLLGRDTERLFCPSSHELFLLIFAPPPPAGRQPSLRQRMRTRTLASDLMASAMSIPISHPLDEAPRATGVALTILLWFVLFLERFEKWIFAAFRARPVPGEEPWKQWERAAQFLQEGGVTKYKDPIGSVRRLGVGL